MDVTMTENEIKRIVKMQRDYFYSGATLRIDARIQLQNAISDGNKQIKIMY